MSQSNSITTNLVAKAIPTIALSGYTQSYSLNGGTPAAKYDVYVNGVKNQVVTADANGNGTFQIVSPNPPVWPVQVWVVPE